MAGRERSRRRPGAPRCARRPPARTLVDTSRPPEVTIVGVIGDTKNAGLRSAPTRPIVIPYSIIGQAQRILAVRSAGIPTCCSIPCAPKFAPSMRNSRSAFDHPQRDPRRGSRAAALHDGAVQHVRRARPGARRRRHLQRPVVPRHGANARTRRAHGARRTAQPRPSPDADDGREARIVGLIVGTAASFASSRLLRSLLFGVQPADPVAYAAVTLVLALIALLACYVPAQTRGPGGSDDRAAPGLRVGSDIHR